MRCKNLCPLYSQERPQKRIPANGHVCFTPKADMCGATAHVCFRPKADMMKFSGDVATAGERGVSLSARFLRHLRRSTGSDCKNHDCLPPRSVGILQTNDNGSPNGHHL